MSAPTPAGPRRGAVVAVVLVLLVLAFPVGMATATRAVLGGSALTALIVAVVYLLTGDDSPSGGGSR